MRPLTSPAPTHRLRMVGLARARGAIATPTLVLALAVAAGCASSQTATPGPPTGGSTTPAATGTTAAADDPTPVVSRPPLAPLADQRPPVGTNGIAFDGDRLWVADLRGGELLAVDPTTGAIGARYGAAQGITTGPDDVAVGPDGSVYWTGFGNGDVGRVNPDGTVDVLGNVGVGANAITFSDDGKLFVGRAVTGDGLWEVDPTGAEPAREITASLGNVNGFAVGADGKIYGPKFGAAGAGSLVRVDPADGAVTTVAEGLNLPFAVKLSADRRTAYVAVAGPPAAVQAVDLATGAVTLVAEVPATVVDNLAVGPKGEIYVTTFNEPRVVVVEPGGATRSLKIGA